MSNPYRWHCPYCGASGSCDSPREARDAGIDHYQLFHEALATTEKA